ncbi:MAG: cytochrome c [Acidimicrobiales bacterium]
MYDLVILASAQQTIGYVVAGILLVAFVVAIAVNVRKSRSEIGSEVALAANRKPYMNDEELETKKLDRTLGLGLVALGVIALTLPLYWLAEPGRQEDSVKLFENIAISRGEEIYTVGAQCANCHGPNGVGGVASYTLLDPATGAYVDQVEWKSPALDTVMYRYTPEQLTYILNYGRGYSPMPAWGAPGGGPLTEQQIEEVIAYLFSIQLPAAESQAAVQAQLDLVCKADANNNCTVTGAEYKTLGEAIFNLGYSDGFAAGAYACGRCHTPGWSFGDAGVAGGGAMGPSFIGGSAERQFPVATQQEAYVSAYPKMGTAYGVNGWSSGRMGSFGTNPNAQDPKTALMSQDQVMLTPNQIAAVVAYERSL